MPTLSPNPGFHQSQPLDPLGAGLSEQGLAFGGMDTSHSLLCTPALPEALSACWTLCPCSWVLLVVSPPAHSPSPPHCTQVPQPTICFSAPLTGLLRKHC